jgi:hypothetical protein
MNTSKTNNSEGPDLSRQNPQPITTEDLMMIKQAQRTLRSYRATERWIYCTIKQIQGKEVYYRDEFDRRTSQVSIAYYETTLMFNEMFAMKPDGTYRNHPELSDADGFRLTNHNEMKCFAADHPNRFWEISECQLGDVLKTFKDAGFIDIKYRSKPHLGKGSWIRFRADKLIQQMVRASQLDPEAPSVATKSESESKSLQAPDDATVKPVASNGGPVRIQLRRVRAWCLPPHSVDVSKA